MTTWSVLVTLYRRRLLVLLGMLATFAALFAARIQPVDYYATVEVRFLAPVSRTNPNAIQTSSSSLVDMAGLVKARVNAGKLRPGEALSTRVVGGPDAGSVYLPDTGNQFVPLYTRPVLVIEATGHDPATALRRVNALAQEVRRTAVMLQRSAGSDRVNYITTQLDPARPQVRPLNGDARRALIAIGSIGTLLTVWSTVELDRHLQRRGGRRRARRRGAAKSGRRVTSLLGARPPNVSRSGSHRRA